MACDFGGLVPFFLGLCAGIGRAKAKDIMILQRSPVDLGTTLEPVMNHLKTDKQLLGIPQFEHFLTYLVFFAS